MHFFTPLGHSFMHSQRRPALQPTALAAALACLLTVSAAHAQDAADKALSTVTVNASADASAQGLSPAYPGGQVARGARAGILGTRDAMDTPFSAISYTNELILDRHARSVGDVLQNDPTVRVARGFGNFQESYFIRGFLLDSDDTAYNGLYSLLPRQYIATELFERVEVLRGASAFERSQPRRRRHWRQHQPAAQARAQRAFEPRELWRGQWRQHATGCRHCPSLWA